MFPLPYVVDLLPDELARLGARRFSFAFGFSRSVDRLFCRHAHSLLGGLFETSGSHFMIGGSPVPPN
jgi:hypothetical protein